MIHTFVYLCFVCFVMPMESTITTRNVPRNSKLHSFVDTMHLDQLTQRSSDNLRSMLTFIHRSPEFHPLTFSVILPEFSATLADCLLRYIADNSIEAYTVRDRDLTLKATWLDRSGLTWIIVVHDFYSLYIYVNWQTKLWRSSNRYLIVFLGREATIPWVRLFRKLWTRYNVYRAVAISLQDDFRCLTRYMPFDKHWQEFGGVRKLCLNDSEVQQVTGEDDAWTDDRKAKVWVKYGVLISLSRDYVRHVPFTLTNQHRSPIMGPRNPRMPEHLNGVRGASHTDRLFENFRDLNHYPVNVIAFESLLMNVTHDAQNRSRLTKLDANVLYTLERALNAKFRLTTMRKRDFRANDPFAVSLTSIENGSVDMVITGFFVKVYDNFREFRFTCAVYEDKLCFLSPDSGLMPKSYMPFLPFRWDVWLMLILYNVGITFLWCYARQIGARMRQRSVEHRLAIIRLKNERSSCNSRRALIDPSYVSDFNQGNGISKMQRAGNGESIDRARSRKVFNVHFESDGGKLKSDDKPIGPFCLSRFARRKDVSDVNTGTGTDKRQSNDKLSSLSSFSRLLERKSVFEARVAKASVENSMPRFSTQSGYQEPQAIPPFLSSIFGYIEMLCYPLRRGNSSAENSLLSASLFFSLVMNGLYQSCLVSNLHKPFHYPQLSTLEDVVESGKPVITKYANLKNIFLDDSQVDRTLNQRIQVIRSGRPSKWIAAFEDKILFTRYYGLQLSSRWYHDKEGNSLLHLVDECPMNYRVAYVLRLHSPYEERVDFVLLRLRESGLLLFWFEGMRRPFMIVKLRRELEATTRRRMALTLDHYSLTFLLLFVGLLSSAFIFCCELYIGKRGSPRDSP